MTTSVLLQRRVARFQANRRGVWSLRVFAVLFTLCLAAEFVANDHPILVRYQGGWYVPAIRFYSDKTFGGEFETEADYRDPLIERNIREQGWMIWPPIPYTHATLDFELSASSPNPPSRRHWLGTDDHGRDVAAGLIYGFRLSVMFGVILTILSSLLGVAAGAAQGYFGGWIDLGFQRFLEIWSGMPILYLLIILASVVEPSFLWLLGIMLLFSWTQLVGVVRAEFLRVRNFDYVRAARALGVPNRVIIIRHILPNAMVTTLTFVPFILSGSIVTLTSLDFLGFGMPVGAPSLGVLLAQGKDNLHAPWLGISGFAVLAIMLSLLIFIGEAVRDAFDPRKSE